jgi:hypothetical protein
MHLEKRHCERAHYLFVTAMLSSLCPVSCTREIAAASSAHMRVSLKQSGFSHLVRTPLMNFEQDISVLVRIDNYKCARATIKAQAYAK